MKFNAYVSWALAGLFVISAVIAAETSEKEEELYLEGTNNDERSIRSKRPFCNAFTGCGKKRSYDNSLEHIRDELNAPKISPMIYRALIQIVNDEIQRGNNRRLNTDNDVSNDQEYSAYFPIRKLPRKRNHLQ